jgi:hypothetical protein
MSMDENKEPSSMGLSKNQVNYADSNYNTGLVSIGVPDLIQGVSHLS